MSIGTALKSGYLLTGLPQAPDDTLDPKVYAAFVQLHNALRNIDTQFELLLSLLPLTADEAINIGYTGNYLAVCPHRIYVPRLSAGTANQGDVVALVDDGAGNPNCTQAIASSTPKHGLGIVTDSFVSGGTSYREVTIGPGVLTGVFTGLVIGTVYYLSNTTAGAIQNTAPTTSNTYQEPVGYAMDANTLWLYPSFSPKKN